MKGVAVQIGAWCLAFGASLNTAALVRPGSDGDVRAFMASLLMAAGAFLVSKAVR